MTKPGEKIRFAIDGLDSEEIAEALVKLKELPDVELSLPLEETFSNLQWVGRVMRDALATGKLDVFPMLFQDRLANDIEKVNLLLDNVLTGSDERSTLTSSVEELFAEVWRAGFHRISAAEVEFENKTAELKRFDAELLELRTKASKLLSQVEELAAKGEDAKVAASEISSLLKLSVESKTKIDQQLETLKAAETDSDSALRRIKEVETETADFRTKAQTSSSEAKAHAETINEFVSTVSKYRTDMTESTTELRTAVSDGKQAMKDLIDSSSTRLNTVVDDFNERAETDRKNRAEEIQALDERLKKKEEQINDQLLKATGKSLFTSFDTRREVLVGSKNSWRKVVLWLFGISASYVLALAIWFLLEGKQGDSLGTAMYLRFSVTLPLAFAIWFALAQYAKERRLEEEYAFRSNISVSLVPYRDEVAKLLQLEKTKENEKLADFVIRSIDRVYTLPTDLLTKDTDRLELFLEHMASLPKEMVEKLPDIVKALAQKSK